MSAPIDRTGMSRRHLVQGAGSLAALAATGLPASRIASARMLQDTPVQGGDLLFVHQQIPASMDANVWTGTNVARIMRNLYDPLVWQPEGGVFVPGLAESWEVSEEGLAYTFVLRQDVIFHDGTPLNAEAVKATYDRMVDPESLSLQVSRLGPYDRTEVIDEYTVQVFLTEPFVVFLSNMSEVALAPASPTAVAELGDEYAMHPVATGPFRVRDWPDDTTLVIERNPDYAWAPDFIQNKGPAYLDTITYRFIEEPATRLIALETGEADIIDAPPAEDIPILMDDPSFQVSSFVVPGMPEICNINITSGPTQELAVRQAMQHGVDREALALVLFDGGFPAGYGPLTSGSWAYLDGIADMYPYDQALAAQLLDEAGWVVGANGIREKDGQPLTVRAVTTAGGYPQTVAEFVQASLIELGFDYVVEAMEYEATARRYADNDYEVARLGYALIDPHDAFFLAYDSSQITGGGQFNRSRVEDPIIDDLIQQGVAESDTEARLAIYHELQQYIMEQALVLPAFETVLAHALQTNVHGFTADLLGRPYMIDVWMSE
ncbi:MAG: ABC transporter substrate-binding protein [Chloroflexota bacterium]|nr:ABC transporter substrate-binding protein [Chloroflexota bacterium]